MPVIGRMGAILSVANIPNKSLDFGFWRHGFPHVALSFRFRFPLLAPGVASGSLACLVLLMLAFVLHIPKVWLDLRVRKPESVTVMGFANISIHPIDLNREPYRPQEHCLNLGCPHSLTARNGIESRTDLFVLQDNQRLVDHLQYRIVGRWALMWINRGDSQYQVIGIRYLVRIDLQAPCRVGLQHNDIGSHSLTSDP